MGNEKIIELLEMRKDKAKKDADNSYSDMEYNRAIGVYYELEDILNVILEEVSEKSS